MALPNDFGLDTWLPWPLGSDSCTGFTYYGQTGENTRAYGPDPWGQVAIIWDATVNDVAISNGGWTSTYFSIDNTKLYRWSVWIYRGAILAATPWYYLGAYASHDMVGLDGTTTDGNAYFGYGSWADLTEGEWKLVVGHVYPTGTIETLNYSHEDSGLWAKDGTHTYSSSFSHDWAWNASATTANHRTYQIYGGIGSNQQWCYPRVDLCDGAEPTIQQLLRHGKTTTLTTNLGNIMIR